MSAASRIPPQSLLSVRAIDCEPQDAVKDCRHPARGLRRWKPTTAPKKRACNIRFTLYHIRTVCCTLRGDASA